MNIIIPPCTDVRAALQGLGHSQLQGLAKLAGVGFSTLWRIRAGECPNPGIETVRKFVPHIKAVASMP